jgi:hypothetical protein
MMSKGKKKPIQLMPMQIGHSSDILSIRFKHMRILRIFGLF